MKKNNKPINLKKLSKADNRYAVKMLRLRNKANNHYEWLLTLKKGDLVNYEPTGETLKIKSILRFGSVLRGSAIITIWTEGDKYSPVFDFCLRLSRVGLDHVDKKYNTYSLTPVTEMQEVLYGG